MKQASSAFARNYRAKGLGVAIATIYGLLSYGGLANAQQPVPAAPAAPVSNQPVTAQAPSGMLPPAAAPVATAAPTASGAPGTATGQAASGTQPAGVTSANAVKTTAAPEEVNPFSNVKPVDNQALKQELPKLEQRLNDMENQMSAIKQVQVALPADALNGPGGARAPGAPGGPNDQESIELEAATFVACVNGQAMFRDSDQKPFFVNAKEANQNEAVRRIGGCKH